MIYVYINYPAPHITIHRDPSCGAVMMQSKAERRIVRITRETITYELRKFADREYGFAATRLQNDMWLLISLDTPEQEVGVVYVIQALLGLRYRPLRNASVKEHCGGGGGTRDQAY